MPASFCVNSFSRFTGCRVILNYLSRKLSWMWKRGIVQWCLSHWGVMTYICISKITTIGTDVGLSPGLHQTIIWTNAGILIGPLGTNFSETVISTHTFSSKKMHLKNAVYKMASISSRTQCVKANIFYDSSQGLEIWLMDFLPQTYWFPMIWRFRCTIWSKCMRKGKRKKEIPQTFNAN